MKTEPDVESRERLVIDADAAQRRQLVHDRPDEQRAPPPADGVASAAADSGARAAQSGRVEDESPDDVFPLKPSQTPRATTLYFRKVSKHIAAKPEVAPLRMAHS